MYSFIIAGCGYVGERIAQLCREKGATPFCMVRSPEHAERLNNSGFATVAGSFDNSPPFPAIDLHSPVLFYLVPPPGGGVVDTRAKNFIQLLKSGEAPQKIIYMSATSVYSETNGGNVTETSPTEPLSAMGKRRLDAEKQFLEYGKESGAEIIILRVSGIYGKGRLPLMQISRGEPVLAESESGLSNRIHVDDLVNICMAAAELGEDGDIFNVSDGAPSSMTSYFNLCADSLGYPRQPEVTLAEAHRTMSPLMLSYVTESKIVDSSKMFKKLNISLKYVDMKSGVPASCISQKV